MSENVISIDIPGTLATLEALRQRHGAVRRGARIAMRKSTLRIRGRTKASFGQTGKPQRRTGHLSRSIVDLVDASESAVTGRVGSTMPFRTGYAAVLELGGNQPGRVIVARRAKALRWFTGFAALTYNAQLAGGATAKQAVKRTERHYKLGGYKLRSPGKGKEGPTQRVFKKGPGGVAGGGVAFARKVHIPQRYQRAMPYLHPALVEERPEIQPTFQAEIDAAIKGTSKGAPA
jgi:hypothetical protein